MSISHTNPARRAAVVAFQVAWASRVGDVGRTVAVFSPLRFVDGGAGVALGPVPHEPRNTVWLLSSDGGAPAKVVDDRGRPLSRADVAQRLGIDAAEVHGVIAAGSAALAAFRAVPH